MKKILEKMPEHFSAAHVNSWDRFFEAYPRTVADIPEDRLYDLSEAQMPPCSVRLLHDLRIRNHQVHF